MALELIERLALADPRNVGIASMRASSLAMASHIELVATRYPRAVELARASIAADARLPTEVRAGLVVRDGVDGAKRSLGVALCALAAKAPATQAAAMRTEAHALLAESRAFKEELVKRGIDGREAATAIREVDVHLASCLP
jgi:hypothetical protein